MEPEKTNHPTGPWWWWATVVLFPIRFSPWWARGYFVSWHSFFWWYGSSPMQSSPLLRKRFPCFEDRNWHILERFLVEVRSSSVAWPVVPICFGGCCEREKAIYSAETRSAAEKTGVGGQG